MGVTIRTVPVPEGGTVKIQAEVPDDSHSRSVARPKSVAKGSPGFLEDSGRKIFLGCVLLGVLLLCGASIFKNYGSQYKVTAKPKVEFVAPIKLEQERLVDINVNKAGRIVALKSDKSGQYYFEGNERIIYCYPTV